MKIKLLYLVVLTTLLLAACSGGTTGTIQPTSLPTVQSFELPELTTIEAAPSPTSLADNEIKNGNNGMPPAEAVAACSGKAENDICSFTDQNGDHTGTCQSNSGQLACAPDRSSKNGEIPGNNGDGKATIQPGGNGNTNQQTGNQTDANGNSYNIEQAISDKAQSMTIAFDALAFLTGDLGADSFFPPGKVADFWGFQYLRDNDPSQMGHAGDFLTSAAMNMLNIMTSEERAQLVALAEGQVSSINEYGYKRFILMQAFQDLIEGGLPAGTTGLDEEAVKDFSAELYMIDGEISYERAQLYGSMLTSFTPDQLAALDSMKGQGMLEWPKVTEPSDLSSLDRDVKVAVMTYAADMLSWYLGSVDADVYFCPERHGTYFGSFYLKDIKAMSDPTYAIPTDMTGNLGDELLSNLESEQAKLITSLVEIHRPSLNSIVDVRRQVSIELRKFLNDGTADKEAVLNLMRQYGEYDGDIIYNMAVNFTRVSQSLTSAQINSIDSMRTDLLGELSHPTGAYLYSQPITMPSIPSSDFLFK